LNHEGLTVPQFRTETTPAEEQRRPDPNTTNSVAIDRCSGCGANITLRPPNPGSKASAWQCNQCGAVYFCADDEGEKCVGVSRIEPDTSSPFAIETSASAIPPENVQRLVKSLVPNEFTGPDLRRHKRYPVSVPVVAVPLAADFRINGDPVRMTTANISLGGAALIHTRYVETPYLALDFTIAGVEQLQVVLRILRVRSVGPVYEAAGEFISHMASST
jgi:predicted RNA-binding Zn-ribbon protein involved in translation (DUF1610 family)